MPEPHETPKSIQLLQKAEGIVLLSVAGVLVLLAVVLLLSAVAGMFTAIAQGNVSNAGIDILDKVLLVMMIMEIVYTVTVSIQSHALMAEPFLIIGTIAAIRRMLVVTAESTRLEHQPAEFQNMLLELALLAATVVALALAVYILRRGGETGPSPGVEHDVHQHVP